MSEDIKSLIEKINQEGIQAAQEKAKQIEDNAKSLADEIISKAKLDSQKIIAQAKEESSKMEQRTKTLLTQAGRDLLLSLKKEILEILNRIILAQEQKAVSSEQLNSLISELVKDYCRKFSVSDIEISVNKKDKEILENALLARLAEEIKHNIVFKADDSIGAGFIISFDGAKSQFDFSDKALAEYIGKQLKPKLEEILKDAASK